MCFFHIQIHGSDWTSFYEQVPKEILPTEYVGEAGSVAEHWGMTDSDFVSKFREIWDYNAYWHYIPQQQQKIQKHFMARRYSWL